jgi:hypothetical protein
MALEGMQGLFEKQDSTAELKASYEQQLNDWYAEMGKLTSAPSASSKKVSNLSQEHRVALVERASCELPLTQQAEWLGVSRSSLYSQSREPSAEEVCPVPDIINTATRRGIGSNGHPTQERYARVQTHRGAGKHAA